jgi:hypothetical protein
MCIIWYRCIRDGIFKLTVTKNTNIVTKQTCEMGKTLIPFNLESWSFLLWQTFEKYIHFNKVCFYKNEKLCVAYMQNTFFFLFLFFFCKYVKWEPLQLCDICMMTCYKHMVVKPTRIHSCLKVCIKRFVCESTKLLSSSNLLLYYLLVLGGPKVTISVTIYHKVINKK